jgi:hypothetical protein
MSTKAPALLPSQIRSHTAHLGVLALRGNCQVFPAQILDSKLEWFDRALVGNQILDEVTSGQIILKIIIKSAR